MPDEQNGFVSNHSVERRTSTWEFLPNLGFTPRNVYKYNESVIKDRHLFKTRGQLVKKKMEPETQTTSAKVALPVLNQVNLSLDIDNGCDTDDAVSENVSVSTSTVASPRASARFNEPLNAYISSRKKTQGFPLPAYMEAFPRSLPSVDQTTMAKKLAAKRRIELQQNYYQDYSRYELLPLLRFGNAKISSSTKRLGSPRPSTFRNSRQGTINQAKNHVTEQSLRVWDPTVMDTLMKSGKVLIPRE